MVKAGNVARGLSDTEVGAAFFVRSSPLLSGDVWNSGRRPVLDSSRPSPGGCLCPLCSFSPGTALSCARGLGPPPVCGFGSPFGRASSLALGRSSLIQESLQRPPPPAEPSLNESGTAPRLHSGNLLPLLSLPFSQSVVSAARAFPPLLRRPPLGAIGHHPLGLGVSSSLGCPVLRWQAPLSGF